MHRSMGVCCSGTQAMARGSPSRLNPTRCARLAASLLRSALRSRSCLNRERSSLLRATALVQRVLRRFTAQDGRDVVFAITEGAIAELARELDIALVVEQRLELVRAEHTRDVGKIIRRAPAVVEDGTRTKKTDRVAVEDARQEGGRGH